MKKIFLISTLSFFLSCENIPQISGCLPPISVFIDTDSNNPELINVQTPGGFAILNGGSKGILLLNIDGTRFVAFDLLCPNNDCDKPMTLKNGSTLKCPCDNSEYSVYLHGKSKTKGNTCAAREYKVTKSGTSIRIIPF